MPERKIPGPIHDSETKNRIMDAATKLFALKGVGTVSMRDIGVEAGIKKETIYFITTTAKKLCLRI